MYPDYWMIGTGLDSLAAQEIHWAHEYTVTYAEIIISLITFPFFTVLEGYQNYLGKNNFVYLPRTVK